MVPALTLRYHSVCNNLKNRVIGEKEIYSGQFAKKIYFNWLVSVLIAMIRSA